MIFQDPEGFLIATGEDPEYEAKALHLCRAWDSGQTEFHIQTSGSTGPSKTIVLPRKHIEASIALTEKALDLTSNDIALCCLSIETIGGLMMLLRARKLSMELWVVAPSRNPFPTLERYRSLFFSGRSVLYAFVPAQLHAISEDPGAYPYLRRAKAILVGGAPIPPPLFHWITEQDLPIFATYGMTETISHIALQQLAPDPEPGFKPLEGVSLRQGSQGNIEILSPTSGPNWLSTQDAMQWLEPPFFTILGRMDNVINSGGVKIHLAPVDEAIGQWLYRQEWVGNYFTWGLDDTIWGQKLVVFFEGTTLPGEPSDFWQEAHSTLPAHWKPKEFILITHFEQTKSQKIDKIQTTNDYLKNSIPNL